MDVKGVLTHPLQFKSCVKRAALLCNAMLSHSTPYQNIFFQVARTEELVRLKALEPQSWECVKNDLKRAEFIVSYCRGFSQFT